MKVVIFIIVAVLATLVPLSVGEESVAPNCGLGGAPDAYVPSKCNCYSGFAPSSPASTDCKVNPLCPAIPAEKDTVGDNGASRPITSFSNDKLYIFQRLPIVENRLGSSIRLVNPVGVPGVTPGTPGSPTCGYPGVLWNKTVNDLSCEDEFRGAIPWSRNGLCGFVLDTSNGNEATLIYKATLVTQFNQTLPNSANIKMQSNAYSISVSFLRQIKVSNMLVNVTMQSPNLKLSVVGSILFDTLAGTTALTLRTSSNWPYQLNPVTVNFDHFDSTMVSGVAPVDITSFITQDTSASLSCPNTVNSVCVQQWLVTINRGSLANCDIEGNYKYAGSFTCRDGTSTCNYPVAPSGAFSFALMPTDFCFSSTVDATADSVYSLKAYSDITHKVPSSDYALGSYVYFDLTVVDPTTTLKGISFVSIVMKTSDGSKQDIIYTSNPSGTAVDGTNLSKKEVNALIQPGDTADLTFSFMLTQKLASLAALAPNNQVTVSVEATVNLVYNGNQKRDVLVAMELSQGSANKLIKVSTQQSAAVTTQDKEANHSGSSPVYTIPFFTLFAMILTFVML